MYQWWKWIAENEKQIKIIFSVFAAIYVAIQYGQSVNKDRREQAFKLVEEYQDGKTSISKERLSALLNSKRFQLWSAKVGSRDYHKKMPEMLSDTDNVAIGDLSGFFARAQICIDAGLCAQDVLCSFLHEEAQSFRENLRGVLHRRLVKMGDVSPTYARKFSTETCKQHFKKYCVEVPRSPDCNPHKRS